MNMTDIIQDKRLMILGVLVLALSFICAFASGADKAYATNPDDGTAYAVLDSEGTLTLFRSTETYSAGADQTVSDIGGNSYTGQVFTGIENQLGTSSGNVPWSGSFSSIKSVDIPDGQIIKPKNCTYWFYTCNQLASIDTTGLDTSLTTNMAFMFYNCFKLTSLDVSGFDTSNVTNTSGMFYNCNNIAALDVSGFNTSKVTKMGAMFNNCAKVPALDVSNFNTSSVTDMNNLFASCNNVTSLDVSGFDTSKVTQMFGMFNNCSKITSLDLTGFDTSLATDFNTMFNACSQLKSLDLSSFKVSNVKDTRSMFSGCSQLATIYVSPNSDWSQIASLSQDSYMFYNNTKLKGGNGTTYSNSHMGKAYARIDGLNSQPGYFTVSPMSATAYAVLESNGKLTLFRSFNSYNAGASQTVTDMSGNTYTGQVYTNIEDQVGTSWDSAPWYAQSSSITSVAIPTGQIIKPKNCAGWFYECTNASFTSFSLPALDTSRCTSMSYMFSYSSKLTTIDVSNFNTSKVKSMNSMFSNCSAVTALNVTGFNTSKVTSMNNMFGGCRQLSSLNVTGFNTSSATTMSSMFYYCMSLTTLDVTHFNTANVTEMVSMFANCSALTALDVTHFDTSNVDNMSTMFDNCSALSTLDVSHFNTAKVTDMRYMFDGCTGLTTLDLTSFDTSLVTNFNSMFNGCTNLTTIYTVPTADWRASQVITSHQNMFYNCKKLRGGNGTTYSSSYTDKTRACIDGLNSRQGYFTAVIIAKYVTYDANTGSGTMPNVELVSGVTAATPTFTAPTGKQFAGWNTQANGSGTPYAVGDLLSTDADITLFAQWAYPTTELTVTLADINDDPIENADIEISKVVGNTSEAYTTATTNAQGTATADLEYSLANAVVTEYEASLEWDGDQYEIDLAVSPDGSIAATPDASQSNVSFANRTLSITNLYSDDALAALIAEAQDLVDNAVVSVDGSDIASNVYWVPQSAVTALSSALTTAQAVADDIANHSGSDDGIAPLTTAINTFKAARNLGSMQDPNATVTVQPSVEYTGGNGQPLTHLNLIASDENLANNNTEAWNKLNAKVEVPVAIHYVAQANGNIVGPSDTNAQIRNFSGFPVNVANIKVDATANVMLVASAQEADLADEVFLTMTPNSGTSISLANYTPSATESDTGLNDGTGKRPEASAEWNIAAAVSGVGTENAVASVLYLNGLTGKIGGFNHIDPATDTEIGQITWTVKAGTSM